MVYWFIKGGCLGCISGNININSRLSFSSLVSFVTSDGGSIFAEHTENGVIGDVTAGFLIYGYGIINSFQST